MNSYIASDSIKFSAMYNDILAPGEKQHTVTHFEWLSFIMNKRLYTVDGHLDG